MFLQPQATTNIPPTVARRRRIGLPSTHDASKERTIEMMLDRVFGRISVLRSLTLDLVPDSSTFLLSRSAVKMVLATIATNSTKMNPFTSVARGRTWPNQQKWVTAYWITSIYIASVSNAASRTLRAFRCLSLRTTTTTIMTSLQRSAASKFSRSSQIHCWS